MYLFKNKTPLRYVDEECEKILKSAKKSAKSSFIDVNEDKFTTTLSSFGIGLYDSDYAFVCDDAGFD
jgi:hypothetical protein